MPKYGLEGRGAQVWYCMRHTCYNCSEVQSYQNVMNCSDHPIALVSIVTVLWIKTSFLIVFARPTPSFILHIDNEPGGANRPSAYYTLEPIATLLTNPHECSHRV